ncbi:hypothetical protein GCM10020358_20170 [Amorphoplanes nipponensis]
MLAVGDVSGHDIEGRRHHGQLRNWSAATRSAATTRLARVLSQLDKALRGLRVPPPRHGRAGRLRRDDDRYTLAFSTRVIRPRWVLMPDGSVGGVVDHAGTAARPGLGATSAPPTGARSRRARPWCSTPTAWSRRRGRLLDDGIALIEQVLRDNPAVPARSCAAGCSRRPAAAPTTSPCY